MAFRKNKDNGWLQGDYVPLFPEKYVASKNPTFRSSWEKKMFIWLDNNKNVIKWASELVKIPYYLESDGKRHMYITDFYAEIMDESGKITTYIIEVKPEYQTVIPQPPKRKTANSERTYREAILTAEKNKAKWEAADKYCKSKGYQFKVLTEKQLF